MPFPLAHPAAVLPLRRFSPRWFNFAALVIGAITPDLSYCLEKYDIDVLAHTIRGCFLFSLPVGLVLVWVFYTVAEPVVSLLPTPHRQALVPLCRKLNQPWLVVPLSVLIGAGTHVFWDSFTHETGWFVERSSFLQLKLFEWHGHFFMAYRLLWHFSTWIGLFLLYRVYAHMLKESGASGKILAPEERRRYALWAGLLLAPMIAAVLIALLYYANRISSVATIPRLIRFSAALYLVVVSLLVVAIGASVKLRRRSTLDQ